MFKTSNAGQRKLRRKAGSPRLPFCTSSPPAYSSPKEKSDEVLQSKEFIVYQTWTLICHTHYAKPADPGTITRTVVTTTMKANKETDLFIPVSTNDKSVEISASSKQTMRSRHESKVSEPKYSDDSRSVVRTPAASVDIEPQPRRKTHRYTITSTANKPQSSEGRLTPERNEQYRSDSSKQDNQQARASRRISLGSAQCSPASLTEGFRRVETCFSPSTAHESATGSPNSSSTTLSSMLSTSRPKSAQSQYPPTSYRTPSNTFNHNQTSDLSDQFQSDDLYEIGHAQQMHQGAISNPFTHLQNDQVEHSNAVGAATNKTPLGPRLRSRRHQDVSSARRSSSSMSSPDTFGMDTEKWNHGRTFSTARSAPTPFTSPEPSPLLRKAAMIHANVISLPRGHSRTSSTFMDLPNAEDIYAQQSHYTKCPHSHPSCARPLNTMPTYVQFRPNLLKYPPFNLRPYLTAKVENAPMVSVIEGSCPSCDLSSRRHLESAIIARYSDHLEMLEQELDLLDSLTDTDTHTAAASPSASTLSVYQASLQNIAAKIADIREQQDREVKKIWQGYTVRWGPGTIGIHHEKKDSNATASICTKATRMTNSSIDGIIDEGRMRVDWIRPDLPE